ncbi:MAG: methionine--tRNA ligase [Nanoarchaeota archaeon]
MIQFAKNTRQTRNRILITSALPYVNNVPHLGNIIGCVLSADVFSRYCKLREYDSLFVCGTDEHGTATETKAIEEGLTPKELCDKYFTLHKKIYEWFNIGFDIFGRTSTSEHEKITQDIFLQVKKNGYIKEDRVAQLFCAKDQKFLADRFVEGTCPHCEYPDARGDQCDSCGHLLNATELKDPRCKTCGMRPEVRESEHLFLDLEKLQGQLTHWVETRKQEGFWTGNAISTTEKWLREGLKPRAISRDLKWGVPIPLEKYKDKVFYVWFDAPIGYVSITAKERPDWKDWWQNPDNVRLFQFMAKDNIPFHTILFPGTLLATKDKWTFLHHINSTEYLNYEDVKFSKSRKSGVFGDDAIETGIPSDVWRYYLLSNRPESADTVFYWKDFQDRLNNELVANIGNLVNRTAVFIQKFFDSKVYPMQKKELDASEAIAKVEALYEKVEIKRALNEIMGISRAGNKYFQDKEPWKLVKENPEEAKNVLANLYGYVRDISILIWPYLPTTAENIWKQFNLQPQKWKDIGIPIGEIKIGEPILLFNKLEDSRMQELKARYMGKQDENGKDGKGKTVNFTDLGLKVAEILTVKPHPQADKLYILSIDIGEDKPRQLVAGLRGSYSEGELLHKKIVVVSNLEPANLRGEKSEGMLLAAGDPPGLLLAPGSQNGSPVSTEQTKEEKASGKKVSYATFSTFILGAKDGKALYDGETLRTDTEEVIVDRNAHGKIK